MRSGPSAPSLHRFDEDQSEGQRSRADVDIDEGQLEQPAAALKKQRITSGLRDNEGQRCKPKDEGGQPNSQAVLAIFNHIAITRQIVDSFPILSSLGVSFAAACCVRAIFQTS